MVSTRKMTSTLSNLVRRGTSFFTPNGSTLNLNGTDGASFTKAPEGTLFTKVDPAIDGEDCGHDCASCTIRYPAKFSIDESDKLYGHVKGWSTHLLVATGKSDWVRDVADEKGSVMEAVDRAGQPKNGKLMLSASNMPLPSDDLPPYAQPTTVLLLPAFTLFEGVTPQTVPDLIKHAINSAPTNTTPLNAPQTNGEAKGGKVETNGVKAKTAEANGVIVETSEANGVKPEAKEDPVQDIEANLANLTINRQPTLPFTSRPCSHTALILLCSQKTRDARCGQSAPLLRREFERHLRPLGLYRDLHDERPGGVGIYFISHVGGHKYSANVMVYRRAGMGKKEVVNGGGAVMIEDERPREEDQGAGQCIWLARVRPEDCEGIVKFTVLQGKVVKPERQLRGGFDRERGVVSW